MAALANGAGRRVQEERAVVGLAIVVAGDAESERTRQDQQGGRECPPAVAWIDERRIERREVGPPLVVSTLERPEGGIDSEEAEHENDRDELEPPGVPPLRGAEMVCSFGGPSLRHGLTSSVTGGSLFANLLICQFHSIEAIRTFVVVSENVV